MLIEHYDLGLFTPTCEPGAERYAAVARFTADIACRCPISTPRCAGSFTAKSPPY